MKKFIPALALLFSFGVTVPGQSKDTPKPSKESRLSFEYEDECGNPLEESMAWRSVEGKVIRVVDGDTIIVQTNDGKRKRVNLVAIDATGNMIIARNLLSELVLNRSVTVSVNPSTSEASTVVGVVHLNGDINRVLLESGEVKYSEPEFYSMSRYTACVYRIVERKARETKKGLWQNALRQL